MATWRLTIDGSTVVDNLYDVEVEDTFNPFGSYAVAKIDDVTGNTFDKISRGTEVDVAYSTDGGASYTTRFVGYAVESRELDQAGADALEVEAYTFDQFLRRNKLQTSLEGQSITLATDDIIADTPVEYVTSNVSVVDNQALTRSYRGEPIERVLRDLAFKSGNEEFGVNQNGEFFFRPRETKHIDRGIDNTQWLNYDIPELGKETVNEVEVWYNGGDESVVVSNSEDKLDIQESVGLADPATQRAEINRPKITDISDAEDAGRQYLEFRNNTLTGTVTTFGLFDAEPGDTINITIDPRGIDGEFEIAAINYKWGVDETTLTIVEKKGNDNAEVLFRLTESVDRIEMQDANRDGQSNRITTTEAGARINVDATAGGVDASATRVTNQARDIIRDGWINTATIDITEIVVGDNNNGLSRSNTDLKNQIGSATAIESFPSGQAVRYEANIFASDIAEVGLKDANGNLIVRGVLDDPENISSVEIDLTIQNDESNSRGVLTLDGQTAVRDTIADNSPDLPDEYAYGSDGSSVSELDTSLGNELTRVDLNEIEIQSATTNTQWEEITDLSATDPFLIQNDRLELAQASFTTDSSNFTTTGTALQADSDFSGGDAERIEDFQDSIEITFTLDYTIPEAKVGVWVRFTTGGIGNVASGPGIEITLNGETWQPITDNAGFQGLLWKDLANDPADTSQVYAGGDLTPGTYTLTIDGTGTGDGQDIDVVAPLDNRYSWTFDNNNGGSSGYLDGPEFYPQQAVISLAAAPSRRDIDEARFTSNWNNTTNGQFVELANDGSSFTRFTNTTSGTANFAGKKAGVDTNLALSRYGSQTGATPLTGINGQYISEWTLYASIVAQSTDNIGETLTRAIVGPNQITGNTIREAGLFGSGQLLARHEIAEFTVEADQRIASAETTTFKND